VSAFFDWSVGPTGIDSIHARSTPWHDPGCRQPREDWSSLQLPKRHTRVSTSPSDLSHVVPPPCPVRPVASRRRRKTLAPIRAQWCRREREEGGKCAVAWCGQQSGGTRGQGHGADLGGFLYRAGENSVGHHHAPPLNRSLP
jgi:hypothetical protein